MGQIIHGSATTIESVRRAIQNSQASLRELAGHYGINPKTVVKWRRRSSVCDARMGTLDALYHKVSPGGFVIIDDYLLKPCSQDRE
jgi:hypothetical protein